MKGLLRIDLMNEQCLTTQHWWMCHICMWIKGSLRNWFDEQTVFNNSALQMCCNTHADEKTAQKLVWWKDCAWDEMTVQQLDH